MIALVASLLISATPPPVDCTQPMRLRVGDVSPCDYDALPEPELTRLLKIETEHEAGVETILVLRQEVIDAMRDAAARQQVCVEGWEACVRDKVPPPVPPPEGPEWYERASFWAGSALALAAVVTGVATGDNHPLLWAAGGVGVGVVIGGQM